MTYRPKAGLASHGIGFGNNRFAPGFFSSSSNNLVLCLLIIIEFKTKLTN